MLGKLIKYEFKATARTFLFAYLALIALALAGLAANAAGVGFGGGGTADTIMGIYIFVLTVAIIAVIIITLVTAILRFGRNLLGNEGYLMFTLPVSTHSLILSKLIAGIVWFIASVAVLMASSFIITAGPDSFAGIAGQINAINTVSALGVNVWGWLALLCAVVIVSWASIILLLYGAMSLGPHITKNRAGGSFIAFIIFSIAAMVGTWALYGSGLTDLTGRLNYDAEKLTALAKAHTGVISDPAGLTSVIDFVNGSVYSFILSSAIASAIVGIVCYFITHYLLKRKLNLA